MRLNFTDIGRWKGELARAPFLVWAVVLFALKYNLDRLLLKLVFTRDWSVFDYFDRPMPWLGFSPARSPGEYALLLTAGLPFLWAGLVLCVKRLRSARLPLWLVVLFVVPVVKWFLFLVLGLAPKGREARDNGAARTGRHSNLARWLPKSTFGSAALALGLSTLLGSAALVVGTRALGDYGWGLFVGVPFCSGFFAALIHGERKQRTLRESLFVGLVSVSLAGVSLLVFAVEGLICILMAAPLALALAALGALVGHFIQAARQRDVPPQLYCVPMLAIPLMLGTDRLREGPPPLLDVTTAIEVDAPPERVWQNVVSFAELPPPEQTLFKLGIAYPIRAEIHGHGVGAVRYCVFSTGPFVEPIAVWDEPRLLRFSVTQNPAPLQEWTPYREVHPPHLDGYLVSRQGQFRLIPLPGGRTRLEGTTWYHHTMWPASYWQLWSDQIIHAIHLRVLNHVKELSEKSRLERTSNE